MDSWWFQALNCSKSIAVSVSLIDTARVLAMEFPAI